MPKRFMIFTPLLVLGLALGLASTASADDERAAVERAVLDYVEAIEQAQPELIDRGVHTDLTKLGFFRGEPGTDYQMAPMDFAELRELAANLKSMGHVPEDAEHTIEILDLLDTTASVKLSAFWGIDYMLLGKFDGQWKIIHVLWQTYPE